jgi:hypothetical protein
VASCCKQHRGGGERTAQCHLRVISILQTVELVSKLPAQSGFALFSVLTSVVALAATWCRRLPADGSLAARVEKPGPACAHAACARGVIWLLGTAKRESGGGNRETLGAG